MCDCNISQQPYSTLSCEEDDVVCAQAKIVLQGHARAHMNSRLDAQARASIIFDQLTPRRDCATGRAKRRARSCANSARRHERRRRPRISRPIFAIFSRAHLSCSILRGWSRPVVANTRTDAGWATLGRPHSSYAL